MAYRYEKEENGKYALVIDGWEKGIADSPYLGITSIKNLNTQYLPGAVYSNFSRTSATSATTIAFPMYWTQSNPDSSGSSDNYYLIDSGGKVWTSSGSTWTALTAVGTGGTGNGIIAFTDQGGTSWILAFNATQILYYTGSSWAAVTNGTGLTSGNHQAIWSQNTNTIYFCNGNTIGSLILKSGFTFDPAIGSNYTINTDAFSLPIYENSTWLSEFGSLLMISAGNRIYPWDQVSTFYQTPLEIKEKIIKTINIQNNLYVLAGYRGNLYISNTYSISLFKKIPDSFFTDANGVPIIEPTLWWGDIMSFRNKIYVGLSGFNDYISPRTVTSGIFSITLGLNVTGSIEVAGALTMESQNSYGLTCTLDTNWSSVFFGIGQPNMLANQNSVFQPQYFSAWYNGTTSLGGIDGTSTVPYTNSETIIESDLVPVATNLQIKTYASCEFKLDSPFQDSGQSITIYARPSLSDAYIQIGTTSGSSQVVSAVYPSVPFQGWQWLQLKVVINSSVSGGINFFTRLKEVRIR